MLSIGITLVISALHAWASNHTSNQVAVSSTQIAIRMCKLLIILLGDGAIKPLRLAAKHYSRICFKLHASAATSTSTESASSSVRVAALTFKHLGAVGGAYVPRRRN